MKASTAFKVTPAMRRELETLLATKGSERFRRSDLSDRLYALTTPRSHPRANALADIVIQEAAKAGKIVRTGHQHWMRADTRRTLKSGREVADLPEVIDLPLRTHCPGKWLSVDLETGDIWLGDKSGWKRASAAVVEDLKALLK